MILKDTKLSILNYDKKDALKDDISNTLSNINDRNTISITNNSLVSSPEHVMDVAKLGVIHGVNFAEQADSYDFQNRTDDVLMRKKSYHEQSLLYLASVQNNILIGSDSPSLGGGPPPQTKDALNEEMTKQLPIYLYDELRQIATDTTNSRIASFIALNIGEAASYTVNDEKTYGVLYGVAAGENYMDKSRGL